MEERSFHPLDYVSVLRRRKWWFIVPLAVCLVAGVLAIKFLPKQWHSEARIGVAAPSLSPELLRGISSNDAVERQRTVAQHLLTTRVLERVSREENLFPKGSTDASASWLRKRVTINVPPPLGVSVRAGDRSLDAIDLGFKDSSRERTQRIANKLAVVFVEENSRYNQQRAENTAELLSEQLRQSQQRLNELETQLSLKKQRHMGRLPSMMDANLQMANGARNQLQSITQQLSMEQQQLALVEAQLQQMRQGIGTAPLTSTAAASIQATQSRLNQLQQQLTQARANGWTEKHPEVVYLQAEIKQARAELNSLRHDGGDRGDALKADPVYAAKIAERDAINVRIRSLRQGADQARAQIAQFQSRVEAAPVVEQDLAGVTREFESEKRRFDDLKKKYDEAMLQGSVARSQGGERFTILYAAGSPVLLSAAPARMMIMALVAGLVLGAGLVVGREFMDRSVHDVRALQSEFEVPVLGEIPRIQGA